MKSRNKFTRDLLHSELKAPLEDKIIEIADATRAGSFRNCTVTQVAGVPVFSGELVLSGVDDAPVAEVEEIITNLVCDRLDNVPAFPGAPLWVSRTLEVGKSDPPKGWQSNPEKIVHLSSSSGIPNSGGEISLGWGNNVVTWDSGKSDSLERARQGIVIAQALWSQLTTVDGMSKDLISDLSRQQIKLRRGDGIQRDLDAAQLFAWHGLCHDELITTIQGETGEVASKLLDVWGHENLRGRLAKRSTEIGRMLELRAQLRSRGYQRMVEMILFGIGLLAILSIVLDLVQTGFSGGIALYPGHQGESKIMEIARSVNLDIALGGTVGVMASLLFVVLYLRRRSDE